MFENDNLLFRHIIKYSIIIIVLLLIIASLYNPNVIYHYEYIDLDNNKGNAKYCSYKFHEGRAGGQGSPVCELEDGTIKQVKEYKYIYDNEYRLIDKITGDNKK